MRPDNPIRNLDPRRLAHYEKENYVAYYRKDWPRLLRVSVGMVKESFGLSWLQAVYAAYLVARAEVAFAPFPDNDVDRAVACMRRFYRFVSSVHHEELDVAEAARLEVNWWKVHRELFGNPQNGPLVAAIRDLYAAAYGIDPGLLEGAASLRAAGMLYSDQWVNAGKPGDSQLLALEEEALAESYSALKEAINR